MMLASSQKQSYWEQVQAALEIAGAPIELADSLLQKIERLPEDQQELFYHAEPLDVARDLSGVERWSDEQVRAYIELSSRESKSNDELVAPITSGSKVEYFRLLSVLLIRLLSVLLIGLTVSLSVLLLVVVSLLKTPLPAQALSIAAGVIAALVVITALMLAIGVPAYRFTMTLKAELEVLEEEFKAALAQNQRLEEKMKEALVQNQRILASRGFLRVDD